MHAQDIVERRSKVSETAIKATQPCHLRCCQEGGNQASISWDHLPHFCQSVGQSHPCCF